MTDFAKIEGLPLARPGDPVLRQVAAEVPHGEDRRHLIAQMLATMIGGRAVGLAAPQVGVSERVIVGAGKGFSFGIINPVITRRGKARQMYREGCLSLPGVLMGVQRTAIVTVEGFDAHWNPVKITARGLHAQVLQHEIDHLDGVLMTDKTGGVPTSDRPRIATKQRVEVFAPGLGVVRRKRQ